VRAAELELLPWDEVVSMPELVRRLAGSQVALLYRWSLALLLQFLIVVLL
jgi:hypothetical protein